MSKSSTFFRTALVFTGRLLLGVSFIVGAATASAQTVSDKTVAQLSTVSEPDLAVKAWLSLDVNSGQVIGAKDIEQEVEPASLTKLMSAYVIYQALADGRISMDQSVPISEKAWKTEGSRMFVKVNSQVKVSDLLQGVIVQSGNDATVALAEAVAGSESAFVSLMNQEAQRQGLTHTHFVNSTGLPDPQHKTTVHDLGVLARNLIRDFPDHLNLYKEKEFTYNNIKQRNRNRLLWVDDTVDGLKTGHTSSAGYCLVATALRDGRRVVTVLVGAESDAARTENSLKLLNWSFQNFETLKLFDGKKPVVQARVWQGQAETVPLGQDKAVWVTVPRGRANDLKPVAEYTQPLIAPLKSGDKVGTVSFKLDDVVLRQEPLRVMQDVAQAGFVSRLIDKVKLMFQ
jgi:D-alanyl-D-alanine carboxypeptidase (penicillin-binding protein 5/6)